MKLADFQAVVLDMDGTLYHDEHALPGAQELLSRLQQRGQPFACLTNASALTAEQLSLRLERMGVTVQADRIYTAGKAMADFISRVWRRPQVCNFAGKALELELGGSADFVTRREEACMVVAVATHMRADGVGFDMDRALLALAHLRNGAHLVAGCADRVFPVRHGEMEFGSGSWAALFQYGADLPADRLHFVGKPEQAFFDLLCQRLKFDPSRCLLVGDNLESDIRGGKQAGMTTALLLSGVTSAQQCQASAIQPDVVFDDLADLLARIG